MTLENARREFAHTWTDMVYLNHAAISPMSFRVRDAISKYLERRSLNGIEPYPWALKMATETRVMLAQMLQCRADQIAFVLNTSDGLNVLAGGVQWEPGDRILLNTLEFPSNVYPFLNLQRRGVEIDMIDAEVEVTAEMIAERLTPQTKLVSISHVQFSTGAKADIKRIGALCRDRDILFAVDAIQSIPHTRLAMEECNVDFVASGSHKWMMAPEGIAFIAVGDRALERIQQPYLGWTSVSDAFNTTDIDPERLRPDAGRFENGTMNFVGIAGLNASLRLFQEFGLHELEQSVLALSGRLIELLERKGIDVITPRSPDARSGIVAFRMPEAEKIYERLMSQEMIISLRRGNLRISPHFYNTEDEVKRVFNALFD